MPTEREIFESIDCAYEYGNIREQLQFEEKIALDTWYKNSLLLNENVVDNDCFVSKSLIEEAGDGLFANRDFKKGEMITEMPTKDIFIDGTIIGFSKGKSKKISKTCDTSKWENTISCGRIICYDIIELPNNQRFRGFKANDKAYNELVKSPEDYLENLKYNNSYFDGLFSIYANRDISKGEEIYVGYGYKFWRKSINQN